MNNDDLNRSLSTFLQTRGVRLVDYGSTEFGVSRNDAIFFMDLLNKTGQSPLGIEVWRQRGDKFAIDSLGGWYSEGSDIKENLHAAKDFIRNAILANNDLLTIQYGSLQKK